MFGRKHERLLLACLVGILICVLSGCGYIGEFLENEFAPATEGTESNGDVAFDYQVIVPGGVYVQDDVISGIGSIDISELGIEKAPIEFFVVNDGAPVFNEPDTGSETGLKLDKGCPVGVYFRTENEFGSFSKTDLGWIRTEDLSFAPEKTDAAPETGAETGIEGIWVFADMDNSGEGLLLHEGNLVLSGDGSFLWIACGNVYTADYYYHGLSYVGSMESENRSIEGTYTVEGDVIIFQGSYLDNSGEEVYGEYFYDLVEGHGVALGLSDGTGYPEYGYRHSIETLWELHHSGE